MPIYKLTPKDLENQYWKGSYHRDIAIVRAPTVSDAVDRVSTATCRAQRVVRGADTPQDPWCNDELVGVKEIALAEVDPDGPEQILDPAILEYELI